VVIDVMIWPIERGEGKKQAAAGNAFRFELTF